MKAVIAESFERIHRSNLIGMGVLPLQFPEGETRRRWARRHRTYDITGSPTSTTADAETVHVTATRATGRRSSSTRWCASTPRAKRTTTATAASFNSSCATCSKPANQASRRASFRAIRPNCPPRQLSRTTTTPFGFTTGPRARIVNICPAKVGCGAQPDAMIKDSPLSREGE